MPQYNTGIKYNFKVPDGGGNYNSAPYIVFGKVVLTGQGDMSAQGVRVVLGVALLSGQGNISSSGTRIVHGYIILTGQGDITAVGKTIIDIVYFNVEVARTLVFDKNIGNNFIHDVDIAKEHIIDISL